MTNQDQYDLFISYRHSGEGSRPDEALAFKQGMEQAGLHVFIDVEGIDTFASITQTIQTKLARSKALLIYLTTGYHQSRACQWELTASFLVAQQKGDPRSRLFVVNPGGESDELKRLPVELQDAKYAYTEAAALAELPGCIDVLQGDLGRLGLTTQRAKGRDLTGSNRFAGRQAEMWRLHSRLNSNQNVMVTGHVSPDVAQICGMGGIGKSLLAEEYALRYSAAYPGGIYWLEAHGSFNPKAPDIQAFRAACAEQYRHLLLSEGIQTQADTELELLRFEMQRLLESKDQRCLWVVDDIPYGLCDHLDSVKSWLAPAGNALAANLITTRSREYTVIGQELNLDVLGLADALELIWQHGLETGDPDQARYQAFKELVEERLGGHALALDIAGATLKAMNGNIHAYLMELDEDPEELLDASSEIVGALPNGHRRSIVCTFRHSIDRLKEPGRDFLRLAAHLAPGPIRDELFRSVVQAVDSMEEKPAKKWCRKALANCLQYSLAHADGSLWRIHALVSATIRHQNLADDERGLALRESALQVLTSQIRPNLQVEAAQFIAPEVEHARYLSRRLDSDGERQLLLRLANFDHHRGHNLS